MILLFFVSKLNFWPEGDRGVHGGALHAVRCLCCCLAERQLAPHHLHMWHLPETPLFVLLLLPGHLKVAVTGKMGVTFASMLCWRSTCWKCVRVSCLTSCRSNLIKTTLTFPLAPCYCPHTHPLVCLPAIKPAEHELQLIPSNAQ